VLLFCPAHRPGSAAPLPFRCLLVRAAAAGQYGAGAAGAPLLVVAGIASVWRAAVAVEALAVTLQLAIYRRLAWSLSPLRSGHGRIAGLVDRPVTTVSAQPEPDARRAGAGSGPHRAGTLLPRLRPAIARHRGGGGTCRRPGNSDQVHGLADTSDHAAV